MWSGKPLPRLWFVTDAARVPDPELVIARLAPGSGVIFRDYDHPARNALAETLAAACCAAGHLFLVAGDPVLAEAVGADGFHAPQWQLAARDLRALKVACPHWVMTAACHDAEALRNAAAAGVDAALVSPVFPTRSHPGAPTLGADGLRRLVAAAGLPVIALGGIADDTVHMLQGLPIAGIAAIGALAA